MSTYSLLISLAILALISAGAVHLIPALHEREVALEVAKIQAAAAAFRDVECAALPATATLDDLSVSSSIAGASWLVRFANGQGMIEVSTTDERLGHRIARAGGGVRLGNITSIPVRRPAAVDRTLPDGHQMRRYFAGAAMC